MSVATGSATRKRRFSITILGRTLEHLGVQMYKRRDVAIAELVANSWDAGAKNVYITVPKPEDYYPASSAITITDDGAGMDEDQVQDEYLVVGRNRRRAGSDRVQGRRVMGRKGIGKLAGFGIASKMTIVTWKEGESTQLTLDLNDLKREAGQTAIVPIEGLIGPAPTDAYANGTRVILTDLKHKTALDLDGLRQALARRFSRTARGEMRVFVNGEPVGEPALDLEARYPVDGEYERATLADGSEVQYYYAFSRTVIQSSQLRGFTVYVREKTAQAPPFFFNVEGTASGQHGTRYLTGVIVADFLDEGTDDESDLISTDRQEIDWEDERVTPFYEWGGELTRRVLREWANRKAKQTERQVLEDPKLRDRIERLDPPSRQQALKLIGELGKADPSPERTPYLVDALVRAYEYRHFHDVVQSIEAAGDDPEQLQILLSCLSDWKVMESRAILEIVKGRIDIIDKFHSLIVNNAPETRSKLSPDNMHDMLGEFPWLLNPEWQVLSEEKRISTQLRAWNADDVRAEDERLRYDFLALSDDHQLVVIEIKRSEHAVTLEELQRLERYRERLRKARQYVHMIMICGGNLDVSDETRRNWEEREDGDILTWSQIYEKTSRYYEHYRAVLEGEIEHDDFARKEREVARTRQVLVRGSVYRDQAARAQGLGEQDIDYLADADPALQALLNRANPQDGEG